ncbi:MAG: hypothetical protein ACJAY7_000295 [Pseudohongiellaceae bacterium]
MIINKLNREIQEQNWISVLADLFIVIIGLFSGLQADSWWQEYQESLQEKTYLLELQEDFLNNQGLFESALSESALVLGDMVSLLEQANLESPVLEVGVLDEQLSSLQSMPTFIPISRAYDNLSNTSDLSLLSSRELKNSLADFYSFSKIIELVQSTHEMQLVNTFLPYMSANTEFARVMISWQSEGEFELPEARADSDLLDLFPTREFRNIVVEKYYAVSDIRALHQSIEEINIEILELLKGEIESQ